MPLQSPKHVREILQTLAVRPQVFVETGTRYGWTLSRAKDYFREMHSIEIDKRFYEGTRDGIWPKKFPNLKHEKHIHFHLGDSRKVLPRVLESIQEPCFIFLDAHYMIGDHPPRETSRIKKEVISEEIQAIQKRSWNDTVVIDDRQNFKLINVQGGNWTGVDDEYLVNLLQPCSASVMSQYPKQLIIQR